MSKLFSPTIKKLLITVVSQGIILGLSVITGFVLPERMGPESFGYWQIYLFYLTYINLFGLGFNDGIALFYGGYDYEKLPFERLRASMRIVYLYLASVCAVGVGAVLLLCNGTIYQSIYLALVLNIPLTCIQCIVLTTFLSVGKTEIYNWINLLLKILTVGLYLLLIFSGHTGPTGIILADTFGRLAITVLCVVLGRGFLFGNSASLKIGWQELWEKSKSGFMITIALISSMLMPVLGRSIVEQNEPIAVYGIYSFAMSLLTIILSFTSVLGTVIFPLLKRMEPDEMTESYSKFALLCDGFVILALLLYLPLMFIVRRMMVQYIPALDYLYILLVMCLPLGRMQLLVTPFYKAKRLEKELLIANLIGVAVMFVSLVGGYMIFRNVIAVAAGTTVVLTAWTFGAELYLYRGGSQTLIVKQNLAEIFIMLVFCVAGSFQSYRIFAAIYCPAIVLYFLWRRKEIASLLRFWKK